ncbi:MAG: hypothetical protein B7Z72_11710 [Gemmatimonadetes bacterium 21-71-4]|nr:MAG: hypothetical protein B7Z72_11710 [Gemmatimonadetes bacterium 21-71-4]
MSPRGARHRPGGTGAGERDLGAQVRRGVALYNAGHFWQAHEALEVVWRQSVAPERSLWQGLIQAAAAMLHRDRGNRHGLLAQGRAAIERLRAPAPAAFPVETARFLQGLAACVEAGGPVPPMTLHIGAAGTRGRRPTKDA